MDRKVCLIIRAAGHELTIPLPYFIHRFLDDEGEDRSLVKSKRKCRAYIPFETPTRQHVNAQSQTDYKADFLLNLQTVINVLRANYIEGDRDHIKALELACLIYHDLERYDAYRGMQVRVLERILFRLANCGVTEAIRTTLRDFTMAHKEYLRCESVIS